MRKQFLDIAARRKKAIVPNSEGEIWIYRVFHLIIRFEVSNVRRSHVSGLSHFARIRRDGSEEIIRPVVVAEL
jgi:hypothetical protein